MIAQAFAFGTTNYVFGLFQKPIAAEFGASFKELGVGMTLIMAASAVIGPFLGYALDRYSIRRGIMVAGAACMGVGFACMSLASSLWVLAFALGCLVGLGVPALGAHGTSKVVANWFIRGRGQALGICHTGTSAGGLLFPPLTALAIASVGWRGALLYLTAALFLIAIPLVWFVMVNRPEDLGLTADGDGEASVTGPAAIAGAGAHVGWTLRSLLHEWNFWIIALSIGLSGACMSSVVANLHPYATDLGIGSGSASLLMSCYATSGIAGKLMFGALADHIDVRYGMWLALGIVAIYLSVLLSHASYGPLAAASLAGGLGTGGILPLWGAMIGRCYGREAFGRVMGLMGPIMGPLLWSVFPLTGWIRDRTGNYDGAFVGFLAAITVAACLMACLRPPQREPGT